MDASPSSPRLLAIVAVEPSQRVQCQQPACNHGVYAAIHVVRDEGRVLVLGSTCFEKRYGSSSALGRPAYDNAGGSGRRLTAEERRLLVENTAALIARFEDETERERQAALEQEKLLREAAAARQPPAPSPALRFSDDLGPPGRRWPWLWHSGSSVGLLTSPVGQQWVRQEHRDRYQTLAPWPAFRGWQTELPTSVGTPDENLGALVVSDIVSALKTLKAMGYAGPLVGSWQTIQPSLDGFARSRGRW